MSSAMLENSPGLCAVSRLSIASSVSLANFLPRTVQTAARRAPLVRLDIFPFRQGQILRPTVNSAEQAHFQTTFETTEYKRGSVGQSKGLSIPRPSVRFRLKPDTSNSHEFELH